MPNQNSANVLDDPNTSVSSQEAAEPIVYDRDRLVLAGLHFAAEHHAPLIPNLTDDENEARKRVLDQVREAL